MSNLIQRRIDIIQRKPISNFKRHVYEEIAIQIRLWYEQKSSMIERIEKGNKV